MKTLITILLTLGSLASFAQTSIEYTYDNAGNRIIRKVVSTLREGVDEPQEEAVPEYGEELYPNPTRDIVNVVMSDDLVSLEGKKLEVYSLEGRLLILEEIQNNLSKTAINLSQYPIGSYIVRIYAKEYHSEWRIIKQ
jgi:hypothetical protein